MANQKHVDWLIIGAGPAGLQFAYFCQQNNIDYLVLEKTNSPGSFFKKFPRHRQLLSMNKVFTGYKDPEINLRWDWNSLLTQDNGFPFKKYSQDFYPKRSAMVSYLKDFAKNYQLKVKTQQEVVSIEKESWFKVVTAKGDEYVCKKLFIATGIEKPFLPNIPGILFASTYAEMPVDPKHYNNKRVLIIGKGNSALETANNILSNASTIHMVSPASPVFAWRTHVLGDVRAINSDFLETCRLKAQNGMMNAKIEKIKFQHSKYHVTFRYTDSSGEADTQTYDEVIACTGFQFDDSVFSNRCKPVLTADGRFPKITSSYESTNVKEMYFLGALMQTGERKKTASTYVNGFRYNIEFVFNLLKAKESNQSLPKVALQDDVLKVAEKALSRVNECSSLWQQSGYLADVIVYKPKDKEFLFYPSVPVDYVREGRVTYNHHLFLVTLEYNLELVDQQRDVFTPERVARGDLARAHLSTNLHPVVRHYYNSHLLSEHHVLENVDNTWLLKKEHLEPLIEYLNKEIKPIRVEHSLGIASSRLTGSSE